MLVIVGVAELSRTGSLSGAAFGVLVGTALFVGGFLVLFAPWWVRTLRDLSTERRERVRAQERADMAAHVHDSVLQTLSLIQKAAGDPQRGGAPGPARGARAPALALRPGAAGSAGRAARDAVATPSPAIEREVEDSYGVGVELIVVGDCPMDDGVGRAGRRLPGGHRQRRQVVRLLPGRRLRRGRARHGVGLRARPGGGLRSGAGPRRPAGASPRRWSSGWSGPGGSVAVHSTPGSGTEVELVLPRAAGGPAT